MIMMKKFKCKKCKVKFNLAKGRKSIEETINNCTRYDCCLRGTNMSFVPLLNMNESVIVDQYEMIPIGAFINRQDYMRKNDKAT